MEASTESGSAISDMFDCLDGPVAVSAAAAAAAWQCPNEVCKCPTCSCGAGCTCNVSPDVNCDACNDSGRHGKGRGVKSRARAAREARRDRPRRRPAKA
ncbi:hypothetical protein M885DRAFT_520675 [Pelagophyceae sp. CCMP2097]|nr:hypothetical protein M885DRAFT_520675 [Pelagophyceae sp. CCMP2097]